MNRWFEGGEYAGWLRKLENSLPSPPPYSTLIHDGVMGLEYNMEADSKNTRQERAKISAASEHEGRAEQHNAGGNHAGDPPVDHSMDASRYPHVVGDCTTYADIAVWHLLRDYFDDPRAAVVESQVGCLRLTAIANRVASLPQLQQWLLDRPKGTF